MVRTKRFVGVFTFMAAMALAFALPSVASAAPTNDNFASAQTISGEPDSVQGTNVGATIEGGEDSLGGYRSVWYSWTAPKTGMLRLTCKSSFYQDQAELYTGGTLDSLTRVTPDTRPNCYYSYAGAFNVTEGTTYHIRVAGFYPDESYSGDFTFGLKVYAPPTNDDFADAQTIEGQSVSVEGTNLGATQEEEDPQTVAGYATGHTVWYSWKAPFSGPVQIDTCTSSGFNQGTLLGVFTGSGLGSLTERVSSSPWGCNGSGSKVSFNATENAIYHILVDGQYRDMGTFTLEVDLAHLVKCKTGQGMCAGTETKDRIFGTRSRDYIKAGGGDDQVYALGANDVAIGGNGKDLINGYKGRDKLYGGEDDDVIHTGGLDRERDSVKCGGGWDTVYREKGKDTVASDCEVVRRARSGGGGGY